MLKLLSKTGDQVHHLDNPLVEYVKIKAFRLEPLQLVNEQTNTGVLMVDGEQVPYGNIQGEIQPGMANAFAFHKHILPPIISSQ